MTILSWLKSSKQIIRRNAIDEFREYAQEESNRLRSSDDGFNAEEYQQAVDLVLNKLRRISRKKRQ